MSEKLKEVHMYHGYCMYLSQLLEGFLDHAIFAFVYIPKNKELIQQLSDDDNMEEWENVVDSDFGRRLRKTMGQLMHELRKSKALDKEMEAELKKALEIRNYIAHGFYKKQLPKLYNEQGIDECIMELRESGGYLKYVSDKFEMILALELEKYGYDQNFVSEFGEAQIAKAKQGVYE